MIGEVRFSFEYNIVLLIASTPHRLLATYPRKINLFRRASFSVIKELAKLKNSIINQKTFKDFPKSKNKIALYLSCSNTYSSYCQPQMSQRGGKKSLFTDHMMHITNKQPKSNEWPALHNFWK